MNYILIGLLLAIGWGIGTAVIDFIKGVLIGILNKNKIFGMSAQIVEQYMNQEESNEQPKNRIGF